MDNLEDGPFEYACPRCRVALTKAGPEVLVCEADDLRFRRIDGVWRFLLPERMEALAPFLRDYATIRSAEGRGSHDPEYYRALPFQDLSGRYRADWRIRAASYRAFVSKIVQPLEARLDRTPRVLDLGSGNGWLSNRLAARGHALAAVDLSVSPTDGLGAHVHFESSFVPMQAEFDHLPLLDNQTDLTIFNSSFHYSTRYEASLREALRVTRPDGSLVIIDTPVYQNRSSGEAMVRERQRAFEERYGTASDALPSENFLTYDRLSELADELSLTWRTHEPWYGLRWALEPALARLRGRREPARFLLIESRQAPRGS